MTNECAVNQVSIPPDEILQHLELLLKDRRFAAAERNARFLRYVVECTLAGKSEQIKETVIASEVYGRHGSYDPKTDSIVRVEATRLRQKLRSFYENEGQNAPLRILLNSGSYVPQFERAVRAVAPPAQPELQPLLIESGAGSVAPIRRQQMAWVGIASAALVFLCFQVTGSSRESGSPNPLAFDAWQEGVALLQQDPHAAQSERGAPATLTRAIERLEFAVAADPGSARAWATLAEAYDYAFPYVGRDPAEDGRRAEAAARRAIALDDRLAEGHHMLALVLLMIRWDFPAAEREYKRTLELDARNVYAAVEYADLLRESGRVQEAADLIRKSRALLPAMPQLAVKEAEISLDQGHPDAAIAAARNALDLKRNYMRAEVILGYAEEQKGNIATALRHYEHVLAANPAERRALPAYGYLLARTGKTEQAQQIAAQLERTNATLRNCAFQIAVVYAGLGQRDRALEWLERAWSTHQVHFPFARVEGRFHEMREDARFRALLAKVPVT